ncbi:hypothetical protein OH77DRAFT_1105031 [Trametes cingulata]|nr:hypothetical protein OH77DRAFT_1105031 [Trametes cingulata]
MLTRLCSSLLAFSVLACTLTVFLRHAPKPPRRRVCARPAQPSAKSSTPSPNSDTAHTAWTHPGDRGCNVIVRPRNAPASIPAVLSSPASNCVPAHSGTMADVEQERSGTCLVNGLQCARPAHYRHHRCMLTMLYAHSKVLVSTYIPSSSSRIWQERAESHSQALLLPHRRRRPSSARHDSDTSRSTRASLTSALVVVRVHSDAARPPGVAFELGAAAHGPCLRQAPHPHNARLQLIRELYGAARASGRRRDGDRACRARGLQGAGPRPTRTHPVPRPPPSPLSSPGPQHARTRSGRQRSPLRNAHANARTRARNPRTSRPIIHVRRRAASSTPRARQATSSSSRARARARLTVGGGRTDARAGMSGVERDTGVDVSRDGLGSCGEPERKFSPRPPSTLYSDDSPLVHSTRRSPGMRTAVHGHRHPTTRQRPTQQTSTVYAAAHLLAVDAYTRGERTSEHPVVAAAASYCTARVCEAGPSRRYRCVLQCYIRSRRRSRLWRYTSARAEDPSTASVRAGGWLSLPHSSSVARRGARRCRSRSLPESTMTATAVDGEDGVRRVAPW